MTTKYSKLHQRKIRLEKDFREFCYKHGLLESWQSIGWLYALSTERMKDVAAKIGFTSVCPLKRGRQIGFKFYDYENTDHRLIFLPIIGGYQAEHLAHNMAYKAEKNANNIMRESGQSSLFGFQMRSGGTEIYGVNWRQAIGILSMARNQITKERFQKKPA